MKQPSLKRQQVPPFYAFAAKLQSLLSGVAERSHFSRPKCLRVLAFSLRATCGRLRRTKKPTRIALQPPLLCDLRAVPT
jgi:hypothetical protein